ncbi:SMI1/KNR4 family protein [Streptomyces sp. NPDC087420]|uniref:SMI1/KNR4 family protein n=1 Tax=Streptomyces sp. NPDC087420 TaxID=3365785 RepID=UPI0038346B36
MRATFADFTTDPPRPGPGTARFDHCHPAPDHLAVDAGGGVTFDFVPADVFPPGEGGTPGELTLTVTALVPPTGGSPGDTPFEITVNGRAVVGDFAVPDGVLPGETVFAVPGALLVPHTNTLRLRHPAGARGGLRLYRIALDPSRTTGDPSRTTSGADRTTGGADRTTAEVAAGEAVFTFRTERRAHPSASWRPAPRLTVLLDRDERALPEQLAWRGGDGAEAAVAFPPARTEFYGHHRAADGSLTEYRGVREEHGALPGGTYARTYPGPYAGTAPHRFRTEEDRGEGDWHASGELRLLIEDGGAPVERVTWHDRAGDSGSLALRAAGPDPREEVTDLVTGVRASDEFTEADEVARNLLDTTWHKWLGDGHTAWLEFSLSRPVAVLHYVLASANDCDDRDPEEWTLQGSHDGERWVTLDTRAGERFPERHQSRGFTVSAGTAAAYGHYRLEITRNAGACHVQLSQVRFFASAPGPRGFVGYHQPVNEGPAGYRGTSVSAAPEREPAPGHRPPTDPDPDPDPEPRPTSGPAAALRTVEKWRGYLAEHSAALMHVPDDEEPDGVAAQRRAVGRLLYGGADDERIAALEERLGIRLPPSYRAFLATSDVRLNISPFMWEMRTTETVDWFRAESGLWEMLRMGGEEDFEEQTAMMDRALLISEDGDAQYWLLDPGDVSEDGEWAAYIWASWYPGLGERYTSFAELVIEEHTGSEDE